MPWMDALFLQLLQRLRWEWVVVAGWMTRDFTVGHVGRQGTGRQAGR